MLNRILPIVLGAVILSIPHVQAQPVPKPPPEFRQMVRKVHVGRTLQLVNIERRQAGLPALRWSVKLAEIGQIHAVDMAKRNYFSHVSPDGQGPGKRATENNYRWTAIGENIAIGQMTSDQVVRYWLRNPEHRANILNPAFTQMGVGYAVNAEGRPLWVQVFGTPER